MKEAILVCLVGLPLLGKEGSGTPVFKILKRALAHKWVIFANSKDPDEMSQKKHQKHFAVF